MPKITEIIPSDIPEWAKDAMDRGQLFNEILSRQKQSQDEIDTLQCHIERLREEVVNFHKIMMFGNCSKRQAAINDQRHAYDLNMLLKQTPAISLQAHDNEIIERCAMELNAVIIGNDDCTEVIKDLQQDERNLKTEEGK